VNTSWPIVLFPSNKNFVFGKEGRYLSPENFSAIIGILSGYLVFIFVYSSILFSNVNLSLKEFIFVFIYILNI